MLQLSNNIFAFYKSHDIVYYQYVPGLLVDIDCKNNINVSIYDICEIDQKEIAIYGWESGKLFGYNDFLIFYDWSNGCKIDTIKIGDGDGSDKALKKINDYIIILQHKEKFYLIDIKKRKIKQKISLYTSGLSSLMKLNDNIFLVKYNRYEICQYKINYENKVIYDSSKSVENFDNFMKFPGNRLILVNKEKNLFSIYG